ncbi:hypothetical protein VTN00DRAFT_7479 [Thermoascus crustaceus]
MSELEFSILLWNK